MKCCGNTIFHKHLIIIDYCRKLKFSWWQMSLLIFKATIEFCCSSPVALWKQRPVARGFDVAFALHLNKRLSKQSWVWWFDTPLRSLIRPCNKILGFGSWYKFLENTLHDCIMLDGLKKPLLLPWNSTREESCSISLRSTSNRFLCQLSLSTQHTAKMFVRLMWHKVKNQNNK